MAAALPADLILRRPDVREAELAFKGAVAHADIQWSDRFPRFVIGLDAQRSYFNSEIQHSNAIRDQYPAMIDLYKALGGGWK